MRNPGPLRLVLMIALTLLVHGCGDGSDDGQSPTPGGSATAFGTGSPAVDAIRVVDLAQHDAVTRLAAQAGGVFDQVNVIYADVTEDEVEEAVVPITSGGTQSQVAYLVLTPAGERALTLFQVTATSRGGLAVSVQDGKIVQLDPSFGPDDPECCPSQIVRIVYGWDGSALVQESQTTEPGPGVKATPEAGG